jgi:Fe-S-cluster containining protein
MLQPMTRYECDNCGACCNGYLVVEVFELDVLREPRLVSADPYYAKGTVEEALHVLQDECRCLVIAGVKACTFLDRTNRCSIYPTRPEDCVAMQAGDEQCQRDRDAENLAPLAIR